jgi:hypothetical protein
MAKTKKHFNYEPYIKSLATFISKTYKVKPFPQVKISNRNQGDDEVFIKTGYYDPGTKLIMLFARGRHPKDVLRSFAHEMIHHYQNLEGRLAPGSYSGDRIVDDENLIKLEEEAYLKGNIVFRSWTEKMQKEIESKPTEHMRKLIKLDENMFEQIITLHSGRVAKNPKK